MEERWMAKIMERVISGDQLPLNSQIVANTAVTASLPTLNLLQIEGWYKNKTHKTNWVSFWINKWIFPVAFIWTLNYKIFDIVHSFKQKSIWKYMYELFIFISKECIRCNFGYLT